MSESPDHQQPEVLSSHRPRERTWLTRLSHRKLVGFGVLLAIFAMLGAFFIGQSTGHSANQDTINTLSARVSALEAQLKTGGGNTASVQQELSVAAQYFYQASENDRWIMSQDNTRLPADLNSQQTIGVDMNTGTVNQASFDCVSMVWSYQAVLGYLPTGLHLPPLPNPDSWCSVTYGAKVPFVPAPGMGP